MTTNIEEHATSPALTLRTGADFRNIYVNWVQPSFTPFDIALLVGHATANGSLVPGPQQSSEVEITARLLFNPAEARIAALLLLQAVETYEKQVGEIAHPKGVDIPRLENAAASFIKEGV